jgi:hypothetical protein
MAEAWASIDVGAPPAQVWELIGGFGSLADWLFAIVHSELTDGGRVRRLLDSGGNTVIERLVAFDHDSRSYSYAIVAAPFPVTGYIATLQVLEAPNGIGSRVQWSARFTPDGVSETSVCQFFDNMFEEGLAALATVLSTTNREDQTPPDFADQ